MFKPSLLHPKAHNPRVVSLSIGREGREPLSAHTVLTLGSPVLTPTAVACRSCCFLGSAYLTCGRFSVAEFRRQTNTRTFVVPGTCVQFQGGIIVSVDSRSTMGPYIGEYVLDNGTSACVLLSTSAADERTAAARLKSPLQTPGRLTSWQDRGSLQEVVVFHGSRPMTQQIDGFACLPLRASRRCVVFLLRSIGNGKEGDRD